MLIADLTEPRAKLHISRPTCGSRRGRQEPLLAVLTVRPHEAVAEAKIEISLNRLGQLFNSFDPSPFHELDLDQDAEEYIIGSAEDVARHRPLCLVVHFAGGSGTKPGRYGSWRVDP